MVDILKETRQTLKQVNYGQINQTVQALQDASRVFVYGNGGGYAHAMHFASDLRKICRKQAFSFDNMAELTARMNDESWAQAWTSWEISHGIGPGPDVQFLFSVGGGLDGLSRNLPDCRLGIVGQKGAAYERIVIPSTSTPVIEGCQAVIAHHIIEQLCA